MIVKHFNKYFKNYLFILFVIGSFIISKTLNKSGLELYYIIAVAIFILGFTKFTLIKDLGLTFKILKNKKLYYYLIPTILLSNIILLLFKKYYMGDEALLINSASIFKSILGLLFVSSIRTFGEEFIFRGFLLIKKIKNNTIFFWILNITQSLIFSYIHSLFVDELISKIVFVAYVFVLSIYFGWLNRKFNSLIPSWIIHWMNGILALILAYISYVIG